jgi:Na+-driven multidrug efflux pump
MDIKEGIKVAEVLNRIIIIQMISRERKMSLVSEDLIPDIEREQTEQEQKQHGIKGDNLWADIWTLVKESIFPTITFLFHPMYQVVNVAFLGHQENAVQLQAAFGLGSLLINVFMQAIVVSFSIALLTLVGQAYGAKDYKLCAIYLRR